jgi:hypothetical protein
MMVGKFIALIRKQALNSTGFEAMKCLITRYQLLLHESFQEMVLFSGVDEV